MDILLVALLLTTAILLVFGKTIKIEVHHKHEVIQPFPEKVVDPNKSADEQQDKAVEDAFKAVIQTINSVMNGGEPPNDSENR